jgi:hypothetical protein
VTEGKEIHAGNQKWDGRWKENFLGFIVFGKLGIGSIVGVGELLFVSVAIQGSCSRGCVLGTLFCDIGTKFSATKVFKS